jgi:serine phosphatase RsbU (regulator of sigma subunit)
VPDSRFRPRLVVGGRPIATSSQRRPAGPADASLIDTLPEIITLPPELPPGPKPKILVVDDRPANLTALEAVLDDLDLDLVKASSGVEALRRVLEDDFALIVLDVNMPELDGFETADLIHKRKRSRHTPIVFLTGMETSPEQMARGYSHGAVDYLLKPVVPAALRSKVSVFVDLHRQADQIRRQTEQLHAFALRDYKQQLAEARARLERERIDQEIRLAREIQQRLFPAAHLPLPGLDIAGASFPAEATGGDYFDYIPMADGGLAVVVGDVCGHGFGPALLMAELRAYLRAFLLTRTDAGEILDLLNRSLAGDTDRFVTLLLARIDPVTRSLVYAGAGHLPGYVLGTDGRVKARLGSTGPPLAVFPDADYPTETAPPLEPGELILFLTDGLVEAHGPDEVQFGTDRILELVKAYRQLPARQIIQALYREVRAYCGDGQPDDMTAVVIKSTD